jgi:hypothetical protein
MACWPRIDCFDALQLLLHLTSAEHRQAGFRVLSHQDRLPGCAQMRIYVLGKTR